MLVLGEIKQGKEIGYKSTHKFQWLACPDCGKRRWIALCKGQPVSLRCQVCWGKRMLNHQLGAKSTNWRGGRRIVHGYILRYLEVDDFFRQMADKKHYVAEHRLVVAKALGRNLHTWEIVHHKGVKYPKGSIEDKQDNRYPENLQLVTDDRHKQITILETQIKRLKEENQALRLKLSESSR